MGEQQDIFKADSSLPSAETFAESPLLHPRIHVFPKVHECDVIGDVHGCYDELAELLEDLGHGALLDPNVRDCPEGSAPRIVFVGDIVDRGDRVLDCVRLVHRLVKGGYALSVIGNHDDRFLRWLVGKNVMVKHGLEESAGEFRRLPYAEQKALRPQMIEFFSGLPWSLQLDAGRLIVAHAAWHASLHDERSSERLRAYTLYGPTTGNKTPEGFPERIDWAPHFEGPELVVFGHQVYPAPYWHEHAIGIDTGCVFGGALTALRYPSMEIVSVKSKRARYHRRGGRVN